MAPGVPTSIALLLKNLEEEALQSTAAVAPLTNTISIIFKWSSVLNGRSGSFPAEVAETRGKITPSTLPQQEDQLQNARILSLIRHLDSRIQVVLCVPCSSTNPKPDIHRKGPFVCRRR